MIVSMSNIEYENTNQVCLIGMPGDGKSTLACSAPNPLFIDTEDGLKRVLPQHRPSNIIRALSYKEILDDLSNADLGQYKTIVIDTFGGLLDLMTIYAKEVNSKFLQSDGTLTMKGWGWLGQEFLRFSKKLKLLNKHVIFVSHATEENDGENKVYRVDAGGRAKKDIMKAMDYVGFVEVVGKNRVINWGPNERYYTKNNLGITDFEKLPNLLEGEINNYMTTFFDRSNVQRQKEAELNEKYNSTMNIIKSELNDVVDSTTATAFLELLKRIDHVYQSLNEGKHLLKQKANLLGLVYNIKTKKFEVKNNG